MYQELPEDLYLKYDGCYLYSKELGGVIRFNEFKDNFGYLTGSGLLYSKPSGKGVQVTVGFDLDKLDNRYPQLGWVNTRSSSFYVRRLNNPGSPYRFRRSITDETVHIVNIREFTSLKKYLGPARVKTSSKTVIVSLFNRDFPNIKKAYQKIISGKRHSLAIHPDYCLSADFDLDEIVLFHKQTPVGFAHPAGLVILWPEASYLYEDIQHKLGVEVCF